MTGDWPDSSGDGKCELCGKDYPVASLARACERRHLEADDGQAR